jgi:hypothetical protein
MRFTVLPLALASAFALAADNAVIAPQSAASHKPQATTYGAEAITIPQMLSYQGKLTDTLGQPVPNGNYQLTFRLYTQPTGGSAFWSEPQTIMVKSGLFSALLGAVTPLGSLPDAGALYLSLQVAADPELSPRLRIASAAYAYLTERASNADLLQGKDTTGLDSRYVNEGQASSVTSNMIVDGAVAAVDLNQMGASSGQVMKWTGSAWAPRNDSVGGGGGGGTVTSVSHATGVVCNPNPITTTGTVRFDSAYGDGRYIRNQFSSDQSADFRITGAGRARQFVGVLTPPGNWAIRGNGGIYGTGVYGTTDSSLYAGVAGSGGTKADGVSASTNSGYFGVRATNADAHGTAIFGAGNGLNGYNPTSGCGGAFTGDSCGSLNVGRGAVGTGVVGCGNDRAILATHPSGSGGAFIGTVCGGYGYAANTSGATYGLYGTARSDSGFAAYAINTTSAGTGIVGVGNNQTPVYLPSGSGGAFTGSGIGAYSHATASTSTGIIGAGNNTSYSTFPTGSGGAFTGLTCGGYGHATQTTGAVCGFYGDVNTSTGFGLSGTNTNSGGSGVRGVGNNANHSDLTAGSGVAGTGTQFGVYGYGTDTTSCGGYFANGHGSYAYVAYYNSGTNYKITGSGTVSTIMATREGKKNLFAPEMPEAYFEDCGEGQLANGHCRVNLEKLFSDCITVNAEHPLKVFVQLMDDCNGVYVKRDAAGFDVYELQGGKSNAQFSWRVLAKWKGNENVRLPEAPGPQPTVTGENPVPVEGKTATATQPQPVEIKSATATPPQSAPVTK